MFDSSVTWLSDTSVTAGETVQIALQVENGGGKHGTFEEDLIVDGETVTSKSIAVEAGGTATVIFEHRFDEPGEHEIAVGEAPVGSLMVTAPSEDGTMAAQPGGGEEGTGPIEIVGATAPADWVRQGFETTVRATVVNTGDRTASRTLTVAVDGTPVANETVWLRPSEREVVTIKFEAVEGMVSVEGAEAGRIEVGETLDGVVVRTNTEDDAGGSGFDPGIVALIMIVVTLVGAVVYMAQ